MLKYFYLVIITSTLCNALNFENLFIPDKSVHPCTPTTSLSGNQKCKTQTFAYSQKFDPILGGTPAMNYSLSKNANVQKGSLVALYSKDGFTGKVTGSYINDLIKNTSTTGDTKLNLAYEATLWEGFTAIASENILIPSQSTLSPNYTSSLEAKYALSETYQFFTQGSYSYIPNTQASLDLSNPYNATAGIIHDDGHLTSLKALYSQSKDQDPALKPNKAIKLIAKRKINKKLNTTLSVKKNIEPSLQEQNGLLSLHYMF